MRPRTMLTLIIAAAVAAVAIAPFIGMESITPGIILSSADSLAADIFWKIRTPRVLTAFLAGAALSVSGMAFQALFRNPLATPFTLGVSSGAAFGAALYVRLGLVFSVFAVDGQSVSAFLGALTALGIVYGLTRMRRGFSTATMLLAGVAVSFFFSSFLLFIQYTSDFSNSFRIIRWLMGGLEGVGYRPVLMVLPTTVAGAAVVLFLVRELNLISFGDTIALSRGVNTPRIKTALFLAVSFMVGSVVAVTGPIGFVGMMSPHICRLLVGHDHRTLMPASFFFGGLFLVVCDTVARTVIAPVEIPVGVITALLGGPFFLWLLIYGGGGRRRSGG